MSSGKYADLLKSLGFQSYLWTQFLGALNDNLYMLVVSLLAVDIARSPGQSGELLALVGALFNAPFFLFSGYAGHLADVFSKRSVLIAAKGFEVLVMSLGFLALLWNHTGLMLCVVFLTGIKSAFFSPAKYGIVPEMLPDRDLSRANGLVEMTTFLAVILGTSSAGLLVKVSGQEVWRIGAVPVAIAVAGGLTSLGIPRVPVSGARQAFRWEPWGEIGVGLRRLYANRALWLTVLAISYFSFLATLLRMDLLLFGKANLRLDDLQVGTLFTFLAIGVGIGSLAAGHLSGDKVELGLVPLGCLGMGIASLLLAASASSPQARVALLLLGFAGGLFVVPLAAYLQQKSGKQEKGRLIAANNFLNTVGLLLASGALWLFQTHLHSTPDQIVLVLGLFTLLATAYIASVVPEFLVRFILWMLTHSAYRIRLVGQEHVPFRGPALLVSNHVSHLDGLLVGVSVQRFIRFMVYRPYYELKAFHWLFRLMKAIPMAAGPPGQVVESLQQARQELQAGHVVCIFAEGAISRTGNMLPFKQGFESILEGLDVPVIPVHLDRLWGSVFSFKRGRFFWKRPERVPYPVTVSFGRPLPSTASAQQVRHAVMELGAAAVHYRRSPRDLLHLRFIRTAKRRWFSFCMADSSGVELTFGRALAGSLLLARWVRGHCPRDRMVGLLLPPSAGGALANVAVLLAGKIPVNLNYTVGREAMASALQQCEIQTILTSRAFLTRVKLDQREGMVCLEEVMKGFTPLEKLRAAMWAFVAPSRLFERLYNPERHDPDYLATVIFSSGSTGAPKGVMLSHHNILSNLEALGQIFWVTRQDRFMGVLPFSHSFGFACTLWFPLVGGFAVIYHPNPADAKAIGEMVSKYKATFLLSTPTFYSTYSRKCAPQEFASLRFAIAGAEKLRESVARAFQEKFGLNLCEGYGCTEMAPVISANFLDVEHGRVKQTGLKPGTVGHPIPGVVVKVVDPDTGEPLPAGKAGLLLVNGPNRMIGYLGQPALTAEVLRDGWYNTGDIASLDDDGFIQIVGRLSRFSKIAGEMVPHVRVEEAINEILGDYGCVVTGIPDEQKGERLVALYTHKEIAPADLFELVSQADLPRLWIPKPEDFYCVEALPTLGTGKLDLKQVKTMAAKAAAG